MRHKTRALFICQESAGSEKLLQDLLAKPQIIFPSLLLVLNIYMHTHTHTHTHSLSVPSLNVWPGLNSCVFCSHQDLSTLSIPPAHSSLYEWCLYVPAVFTRLRLKHEWILQMMEIGIHIWSQQVSTDLTPNSMKQTSPEKLTVVQLVKKLAWFYNRQNCFI
jgi:hypothetical protein